MYTYEFFTTLTEAQDAIQMLTTYFCNDDIVTATSAFNELSEELEPVVYMFGDR